jgi:methionine synthase II (cobalamin-independent)
MSGLDIHSTPFAREIAAVTGNKTQTPCRCYDLEFLVKGKSYKPLAIMGVNNINDFIDAFYKVYAFQFKTTAAIREVLRENNFETEVGPGVYDIHSPRIPSVEEITRAIKIMLTKIDKDKLWVNPDCGLKTRGVPETEASLKNMVKAAEIIRAEL